MNEFSQRVHTRAPIRVMVQYIESEQQIEVLNLNKFLSFDGWDLEPIEEDWKQA